MNKWLLIGLAALVAGLAVATWRGLGSGDPATADSPTAEGPKSAAPSAGKPVATARAPSQDRAAAVQASDKQAAASPETGEDSAEALARFSDVAVPRELYTLAAGCYQDQAVTSGKQKMEVEYRLTVADGTARVAGTRIVGSELGDRQLEDCILSKIDGHSWEVAGGFELDEKASADFTMSGLRKLASRRGDDSE